MAKQAGIHGLRGKVNGMSYYYSKNGGELTRKINEGIGERVKSSAAYVNTRKNNAEFGAAGAVAGAIMRTIPQKYRYILKSTATGLLNKELKKMMSQNPNGNWGERVLTNNDPNALLAYFNTLSKNVFPEEILSFVKTDMLFDTNTNVLAAINDYEMSQFLASEMEAIGATHASLLAFALSVDMPIFDDTIGEYATPQSQLTPLESFGVTNISAESGSIFIPQATTLVTQNVGSEDFDIAGGLFLVFLPERKVGTGYNILQEHCSAAWIPIKSGTIPEP